jgi:2-phospho-L-lactate/phosphoenolpyruvate guanylyltransferase
MILIPVKNLATAKQRRALVADQAARTELAQAMLCDVLDVVREIRAPCDVSIVTSDPFALEIARTFNFSVISDVANRSETDAIEMATRISELRGIRATLVIPGDIPLIATWELDSIFRSAPDQGSVLVPSADGRGTNAVYRNPAGLFRLQFGNDSFPPHLAAAQKSGMPCTVLRLPGIGLDIDTPSDLQQLATAPGETRAQRLARKWQFEDLPVAANE